MTVPVFSQCTIALYNVQQWGQVKTSVLHVLDSSAPLTDAYLVDILVCSVDLSRLLVL